MGSPLLLDADQVTPVVTSHGEGPVWDAASGVLRFVDLDRGNLMTFDPATGRVGARHLDDVVACVRPRAGGGLAVALRDRIALLPPGGPGAGGLDDVQPEPLPPVFDEPGLRFNDGGCDPGGVFWIGSMAMDAAPGRGRLHRVLPDGSSSTVLDGLTIPNGIWFGQREVLAADRAYWSDSPTHRVDVLGLDLAAGSVSSRVGFVGVRQGEPDGLTVDDAGGLWVAVWGAHEVHRYDRDGRLDVVVRLPPSQVSCPAFGGEGLQDLYVTTSRQGLPDDAEPLAGALFRLRLADVPQLAHLHGLPVLPFAG